MTKEQRAEVRAEERRAAEQLRNLARARKAAARARETRKRNRKHLLAECEERLTALERERRKALAAGETTKLIHREIEQVGRERHKLQWGE